MVAGQVTWTWHGGPRPVQSSGGWLDSESQSDELGVLDSPSGSKSGLAQEQLTYLCLNLPGGLVKHTNVLSPCFEIQNQWVENGNPTFWLAPSLEITTPDVGAKVFLLVVVERLSCTEAKPRQGWQMTPLSQALKD